jgi:glycosyltransferase involved in cell wall biosynthesis
LNTYDKRIGVVVIGRNEGERLVRCLDSLISQSNQLVYVDSGSTDDSVAMSRSKGVEVVMLDISKPFTAARARNEGFKRLLQVYPHVEYVQFVDGDCEVNASWLGVAAAFLDQHQQVVAVCGRRRERYPDRSIYNKICDVEWDTPVGEAKACGGDAMFRSAPLLVQNGYNPTLIAGEEPELCVRFRLAGWKIWRINAEMTLHDAAMLRFSQWWKRSVRTGYAFAQGVDLHGHPPERHWVAESRRALIWGGILPFVIFLLLVICPLLALGCALIYLLQVLRLGFKNRKNGLEHPWSMAFYLVLSKFPEFSGQLKFLKALLTREGSTLIEYK